MSLLEDIYLQDEANEARELERVIEDDGYDERQRSSSPLGDESDNDKGEDEAEEDKRRVDPSSTKTKKVAKNPRFVLNPARLTGPRGIQVIPDHFKDFKFKGKGHEKEDLDMVLKKLEHWAYRLYPKFEFQDCLKKIESLGKKRPVMVHLHKIRTDQFLSEETVVQNDSDDEAQPPVEEDEFDKLLQQQIDLARATPAPGSTRKPMRNDDWYKVVETPIHDDRSALSMPKATSSPSISEEQKERMLRNRKLAEERRLARLKQAAANTTTNTIVEINDNSSKDQPYNTGNLDNIYESPVPKKINKSNVIESSDSEQECNITVEQSVVVDIHNITNVGKDSERRQICEETDDIELTNVDDKHPTNIDDNEIVGSIQNSEIVDPIQDSEENINKTINKDIINANYVSETSNNIITIIAENQISQNGEVSGKNDDDKNESNVDGDQNETSTNKIFVEKCSEATENKNLDDDNPKSDEQVIVLQTETAANCMDDVMDVDFSDDF